MLIRYVPAEGDDGFGYWRTLTDAWSSLEPLVNVEWDMEFSDTLVAGLLDCPHPLCAYAYRVVAKGDIEHFAHATAEGGWNRVDHGVTFADMASIGFCKIAPLARRKELHRMPWQFVEQSVNEAIAGRWHIHWPAIRHDHDYHKPTPSEIVAERLAALG